MLSPISRRRLVVIPAMALLVAACGDDSATAPPPPPPSPNAPTASISASPTVVPRSDGNATVVTLDGSGSTDPNGDQLTHQWTVASGTFVNGTTLTDSIAQVTFPGTAPYLVRLRVTDPDGNTGTATTTIALGP